MPLPILLNEPKMSWPEETNSLVIIDPIIHEDDRGYFYESYSEQVYKNCMKSTYFVQENESCSGFLTIRGLHWQTGPHAQSKLVKVVQGSVYDVAVDIRVGSPTFGKATGVLLSAENHRQFYIPRGFAHGFLALGRGNNILQYKCDNYYNKSSEAGISWKSVDIEWPLDLKYFEDCGKLILSEKDLNHPTLDTIDKSKLFDYGTDLYLFV